MSKIILITGVSSGIGKALVKKVLEKSGDDVVVGVGRKCFLKSNDRFCFYKYDLKKPDKLSGLLDKILRRFGRVDVLINNAGFAYRGLIEDCDTKEIKEQMDVNFVSPVILMKFMIKIAKKHKLGHIININSIGIFSSTPTLGIYYAGKAALDTVSRVLDKEISDNFNIKISNIYLGAVRTDFGKNILDVSEIASENKSIYDIWKIKYKNFFDRHLDSDKVAEIISGVVTNPRKVVMVDSRDKMIFWFFKFLPSSWFNYLISNYFYK